MNQDTLEQISDTTPAANVQISTDQSIAELTPKQQTLKQYQQSLDEGVFLKNQGNQFFQDKQYVHAITQYSNALGLCQEYYLSQCPEELLPQFRQLQLSLLGNLSACYLNTGNNTECITLCSQIIRYDPNNQKALFRRASAYQNKEYFDEAYDDINKAWDLVKSTTQDRTVFDKRQEIRKQKKQFDAEHKQKNQDVYKKMFSSETTKQASQAPEPEELQESVIKQSNISQSQQNQVMKYGDVIFKAAASVVLAATITELVLEDSMKSNRGLIEATLVGGGILSAFQVKQIWHKFAFGSLTAGLITIVLYNKLKK